MKIGKSAAEREKEVAEYGDDVWVKGFPAGQTRVRIMQHTDDWVTYREHYAEGPGYFPCNEEPDCVGCVSDAERTQQRSRKYAFNALSEAGRMDIRKVGSRLFKTMKGREQRIGTLLDRDYLFIRTGEKLDTLYDVEPGEKYSIESTEQLNDIYDALEAAYVKAQRAFSQETDDEPDHDATPAVGKPASRAEAPKIGKAVDPIDFGSMETTEIKKWLDERKVDYPARISRPKLIEKAQANIDTPPF